MCIYEIWEWDCSLEIHRYPEDNEGNLIPQTCPFFDAKKIP